MPRLRPIPKGCGNCSNKILELHNLVARCLKCGWSRNLEPINAFIIAKNKVRNRIVKNQESNKE